MKIHYFQRYHAKENVATANTMLLLSRLYQYSTDKFFRFLNSWAFPEGFESEIVFQLQEKNDKSVLDATITQDSFKIAVETKLSDWFYTDQLERHLSSFKNEKQKVLLTLAPEYMETEKRKMFESRLATYNASQDTPIRHVNTTFEELVNRIQEVIDDRDYSYSPVVPLGCRPKASNILYLSPPGCGTPPAGRGAGPDFPSGRRGMPAGIHSPRVEAKERSAAVSRCPVHDTPAATRWPETGVSLSMWP